ncbi:MAG: NDP-sugar synthase [Oscillospiraceae bacterium]
MKAVIMAGGMGTRLRPICDAMPKPMTGLCGRPLLEHLIELLKLNGFRSLCLTLGHKPECIRDYFGDGGDFGVSLEYRLEEKPLGTAGGVGACRDFYGDEDFLVISGDAACDFDLRVLMREHKARGAMVTMALFPHPEPLRYGTVLIDRRGQVISFIEKPCWERVVTDLVNTGVYIVSPAAMELVPRGQPFDFARDLFPLLAKKGGKIVGIPMSGYWCDIGDPKSYLRCCMDALDGKLKIDFAKGYSYDATDGGEYIHPSLICENVEIGRGAIIEHSILHSGSRVGAFTRVKNSVVDGAYLGEACLIDGSVICRDAKILPQTLTHPGDVCAPVGWCGAKNPPPLKIAEPRRALGLCRELACTNRARLMREMSSALWEAGADFMDGLTLHEGNCSVRIAPLAGDEAISIEAVGGRETERLALCKKYGKLAQSFGGQLIG